MLKENANLGFTLIEILISVMLLAVLVGIVGKSIKGIIQTTRSASTQAQLDNSLFTAGELIRRVGRSAISCNRQGSAANPTLECTLDLNSPASGPPYSKGRFTRNSDELVYQRQQPGSTTWTTISAHGKLDSFVVCDDADMLATGDCSTFPLNAEPLEINKTHVADLTNRSQRFFRYFLSASAVNDGKLIAQQSYQSSFFVRNPVPASLGAGIVYQFGD